MGGVTLKTFLTTDGNIKGNGGDNSVVNSRVSSIRTYNRDRPMYTAGTFQRLPDLQKNIVENARN